MEEKTLTQSYDGKTSRVLKKQMASVSTKRYNTIMSYNTQIATIVSCALKNTMILINFSKVFWMNIFSGTHHSNNLTELKTEGKQKEVSD